MESFFLERFLEFHLDELLELVLGLLARHNGTAVVSALLSWNGVLGGMNDGRVGISDGARALATSGWKFFVRVDHVWRLFEVRCLGFR